MKTEKKKKNVVRFHGCKLIFSRYDEVVLIILVLFHQNNILAVRRVNQNAEKL